MFSLLKKTSKIHCRHSIAFFLLLACITCFTTLLYSQTTNSAVITFVSGETRLSKGGSAPEPVKVNDVFQAAGQVSTGGDSRTEIVFPDGTLARLGSNTVLNVDNNTRGFTLERGTLLMQVPKEAGSINIITGNVSYEADRATVLIEHAPGGYAKFIVVEGAAKASISSRFGERIPVDAGKMLILPPGSNSLPDPVDVDLRRLIQTSTLIHLKGDIRTNTGVTTLNLNNINNAVSEQQKTISAGTLINTNLVMLSGASLVIASDNLLKTLESRSDVTHNASKQGTFTLGSGDTIDMGGQLSRNNIQVATGDIKGNPAFTVFDFDSLNIAGTFGVAIPSGTPDKLELDSQSNINVTGPFTVNSGLSTLKLAASNGSVNINQTISASIPALSVADRAKLTQASGEYYGVDKWQAYAPIATGTKLVHGATSDAASTTVAYSNYFATEQAKQDAMTGSNVDARLYNGFVQVGPYRNPSVTGDFTYRSYVITYEVMRPLPVTYALVSNNPQHNTTGAQGGHDQYFTPFRRQDLIRLGYIKTVESVAAINTVTDIPRYVALSGSTTTYDNLNTLAQNDYYTYFNTSAPDQLAEAERLRLEATALRNNKSRSSQELTVNAKGSGGDITLGANANIDGFANVGFTADRNITISGGIWGTDTFSATAGGDLSLVSGALIEAFTDNRLTGGGSIGLNSNGTVNISGRVQASNSPWIMGTSSEKPGSITIDSQKADPDSIAIDVTSSGQILALLYASLPAAGRAKVQLTSAGGKIQIDGLKDGGVNYGKNIVADYGDLSIVNNGTKGIIDILSGAGLQADIIKIGALGTQGVLNIYAGSKMDANTQIKLYGGELSGGAVVFGGSGTVTLTSPAIIMSADKVQVNTGVYIDTGTVVADVYANKRYWTPAQGGDAGSTQLGTWSKTPNNAGGPKSAGSF
ncbi:MAG: FecR family protein [Proteobacteria bacterium]|nr:FecR family protein [Pseudomonadota bacterium]